MVSDAIFIRVGVVGMRGTIETTHVFIVLRMVVFVANDESDGATG